MSEDKSRPEEDLVDEARDAAEEEGEIPAGDDGETASAGKENGDATGDELAEARARAEDNWEALLRARAEMDNLRKRNARDLEQARKFALERFIKDLLPVLDSLEQRLEAAREQGRSEKLVEGTELTLKMFAKVLSEHGVEEVDPQGEKFDPDVHEAMTMQPSREHEPETVMMVLQKGYVLNGCALRPGGGGVSSAGRRECLKRANTPPYRELVAARAFCRRLDWTRRIEKH